MALTGGSPVLVIIPVVVVIVSAIVFAILGVGCCWMRKKDRKASWVEPDLRRFSGVGSYGMIEGEKPRELREMARVDQEQEKATKDDPTKDKEMAAKKGEAEDGPARLSLKKSSLVKET